MQSFTLSNFTFTIDSRGQISEVIATTTCQNYIAPDQPSPLLQIFVKNNIYSPSEATFSEESGKLRLFFAEAGIEISVKISCKRSYAVFEIIDITPEEPIDVIMWGPFSTLIGEIVGDIIGVVRNREFALGLQALNIKTIGGWPEGEYQPDKEYSLKEDRGTYPNLPFELTSDPIIRGKTARATEFGSTLQMYCRQRVKERIWENWGHRSYFVPAIYDETGSIRGSKIAFFGCPASEALDLLGEIEVMENLPHPTIDGIWAKQSPRANRSYLIMDFGEHNIDHAIELTKKAGLDALYHSSPFAVWGHFTLKNNLFPGGRSGFKACVEKARDAGISVGVHSLSNFLNTGDAYVSPVPDPRLGQVGFTTLTQDIDDECEEIPIQSPEFFRKETTLNTVMIGEELIHYMGVSDNPPWKLLDCDRGEWRTREMHHAMGEKVSKLMDHSYRTFLTDMDLSKEVAANLATFCNETGVRQLSMDGLEGNWSTGHRNLGVITFTHTWYETLDPTIREGFRNDASMPDHFNWHINTYYNWGEPWYGGFRESQTLYRFKNQLFYERNFIPKMLGWFSLRKTTSIEDAEWLLARAAGYGAGFTLALSPECTGDQVTTKAPTASSESTGAIGEILDAINCWETARLAGAFGPEIRLALCDNKREFHLKQTGEGAWDLYERNLTRYSFGLNTHQVPVELVNNGGNQTLQFILKVEGKTPIRDLEIILNGKIVLLMATPLGSGRILKYVSGDMASVYDEAWNKVGAFPLLCDDLVALPGKNAFMISCSNMPEVNLHTEISIFGVPIRIETPKHMG